MTGTAEKTVSSSPKAKNSPTKKVSPSKKDSPIKNGSPTHKDLDATTKALNLLAQGKRHLLVNDVNSAVDALQEACRMLAEQHGETAAECGDAYFYYGRALLDLSRIESGVLGNALDGVPEGDDLNNSQVEDPENLPVEEKEKVAEQVAEALEENFKSLMATSKDSKSDEPMEDDKSDAKDKSETAMDTDSAEKVNLSQEESQDSQDDSQEEGEEDGEKVEGENEKGDGVKEEGEKTEEADDLSNLQLAWEMLELSKVIYQRQAEGDKAMALKTAQVFLKLGEVCLENENYPQSIEDFQSCLNLQEANMEADNRCLAETHYQLGVAHSFSNDFDKAIQSFTKALKIIEQKVANLEKTKEGSTKDKEDAETMDDSDAEINDLILLIPEIKEKITDMEEMKKDTKDKINKVKKELGMASAIGGDAKPIEATMIKKRKPESEVGDEPKKTKAVNGEAKPCENGN